MAALPRLIYRFNINSIRFSTGFFVENDKLMLKLIQKFKGPRKAERTILKTTKLEDSHFLISKLTKYLE